MSKVILVLSFFFVNLAQAETRTVDHVNLKRYLGNWYEIASIPQRFSEGCHCTRAKYGLRRDGQISVFNSCNKDSVNGELSEARGFARVDDEETNAKLRVSFFWPFFGDYWIIGLDSHYRYAVVSNEEGTSLWILSRTPKLNKKLLAEALGIAKANGIDTRELSYTEQRACIYPK